MTFPSQTIEAPAKINLFLKVERKRPDGYHEIYSVMQKLGLADKITVRLTADSIKMTCSEPSLPNDDSNLVCRAARLFFVRSGIGGGADIILEKNIPVAAGLGGGSSDAAAVLISLNKLSKAGLSEDELADLGLELGADVPFFVRPSPAAVAKGIGERLKPASGLTRGQVLLVNPGFPVSTKWVYENLALTSVGNPYILAPESAALSMGNSELEMLDFGTAQAAELVNDLEAVTIQRYPEIGRIKETLLNFGARAALMSGSGPTVFGLFAREPEAQAAFRHFLDIYPESVFLTEPRTA